MAYVISDECISCGACASECPVEAISEVDCKYVIAAATCSDCGNCSNVCPVVLITAAGHHTASDIRDGRL